MPPKTGVTDTFAYMGHFLPIALITFCVDIAFSLILWAITLMILIWRAYPDGPEEEKHSDDENLSSFMNQKLLDGSNASHPSNSRTRHSHHNGRGRS